MHSSEIDVLFNSDFINGYFTKEERDRILPWKIINDYNPKYKTPGGVNTTDKVFCLSIEEVEYKCAIWSWNKRGFFYMFCCTFVEFGVLRK